MFVHGQLRVNAYRLQKITNDCDSIYDNGFGEVYDTTHFGSTITVQDE